MSCLCSKREPCPIHKDFPLKPTIITNDTTYVIHIYMRWPVGGSKTWYYTVAKDAIRVFESEDKKTKQECVEAVKL